MHHLVPAETVECDGVAILRLPGGPGRSGRRGRRGCAASADDPGGGWNPTQHRPSAVKTPRTSSTTAAISARSTRDGNPAAPERVAKPSAVRVLTHLRFDGRAVSFFGDLHPSFSGNVVKAMGGTTLGYPVVSRILARRQPSLPSPDELRARLHEITRLTPNIIEVVVRAPIAARAFRPSQFYRLQNYEHCRRSTASSRSARTA
jgi:hypothetical protein